MIAFLVALVGGPAYAADECTPLAGNNVGSQNYTRAAQPVYSYLTTSGGGYLRVQGNVGGVEGIVAAYYSDDFSLIERRTIAEELPVFGGFYETADNYFVVSGQNNASEDDSTEVFRVTKYDKSWNRLGSCGLYGANTTIPFRAGSCRFDSSGKFLVVRTSHQMYKSSDGLNHQANVTMLVDTQAMTVLDSFTAVMNSSAGYVSHSFNQFVRLQDNKIVAVDHGDAYPRSFCLMRYPTDVTSGAFRTYGVATTDVLSFPGSIGNNTTGASVGAFEISSSSYLIVGNSVVQDEKNTARSTRNVFVAAVDQSTSTVTTNWLTSFEEGETSASTPHMVKVRNDRFLVLWERSSKVYYAFVDGYGRVTSTTYELDGALSDCAPIIVGGNAVWYTWNNGNETFYQIPIDNPANTHVTARTFDHDYEFVSTTGGIATLRCSKCGNTATGKVPTSFSTYWQTSTETSSYYTGTVPNMVDGDDFVRFWVASLNYSAESDVTLSDMTWEAEDPSACTIVSSNGIMGSITFNKAGTVKVFAYPTYNRDIKQTYTFTVLKPLERVGLSADVASPQKFGSTVKLTAAPEGGKGALSYEFVIRGDSGQVVVRGTDSYEWTPGSIGTYHVQVNVTDAGDGNSTVSSEVLEYTVEPAPVQVKGGGKVSAVSALTYGQPLSELAVQGAQFVSSVTGEVVEGTFAFDDPSAVLEAGEHDASFTFTPASENYLPAKGTVKVVVDKATPQVTAVPTVEPFAYHPAKPLASHALVGGSVNVPGTWEWSDPSIIASVPGGSYECTFVPSDSDNYNQVQASVPVSVSKATPFIDDLRATGITYGQTLADSALSGLVVCTRGEIVQVEGALQWVDASTAPQVADGGKTAYAVRFVPADADNYESVQAAAVLAVAKADHPAVMPSGSYNVAYGVSKVSNGILSNAEGWEFEPADLGVFLEPGRAATFMAHYVASDAPNFETVEMQVSVMRSTCEHAKTEARGEVMATCTQPGYSGDVYCIVCGELLESGHVVGATGHFWGEGVITAQPTCTEEGLTTWICAACGQEKHETIEAMGHSWPTGYTVDKQATYSEEGLESIHCEKCGATLEGSQRAIPKRELPDAVPSRVSPDSPAAVSAVEEQVVNARSDNDQNGSVYGLLQAQGAAKSKNSVKLVWKAVPGATGYVVYGSKCGKKNRYQKIKTLDKTIFTHKKLKAGTYYKYLVVATSDDRALAVSKTVHVATKGEKVGNFKAITTKAKAGSVVLVRGGKFALKAKAQVQSKKLKVKNHRSLRYESSNPAVASVSTKGVIAATSPGTCTVYAYAQNGVSAAIRVTVS